MKISTTPLLLALVFVLPAMAEKPEWAGKGKPTDEQKAAHVEAMRAKSDNGKEKEKTNKYEELNDETKEKLKDKKGKEWKEAKDKSAKADFEGKKDGVEQKELNKGSEEGQVARQESKKWWQLW